MSAELGVALPFWLDRPDEESVEITLATERAGIEIVWVGEMATLTSRPVDVALGASSPTIVAGWHDRPWEAPAARMAETVPALRSILAGGRAELDGPHVRTHGFRLRRPQPDASICVAAVGPAMTRVAARQADAVVLNLVTAEHLAGVRARIDAEARTAGRPKPRLAVWMHGPPKGRRTR